MWAVYTQSFGLSLISSLIIIFTLGCLLFVYRSFVDQGRPLTKSEQFLVVLPLSALASWLTAATIVNIAASLKYHGAEFAALAPTIATGVVFLGGLIASATIWFGRGNPWYAIVFVWALAGIYSAASEEYVGVGSIALLAAALVIASTLMRLSRTSDRRHWIGSAITEVHSAKR